MPATSPTALGARAESSLRHPELESQWEYSSGNRQRQGEMTPRQG
nr:hypothetical protein [uncultured Porphyromonas sp.]